MGFGFDPSFLPFFHSDLVSTPSPDQKLTRSPLLLRLTGIPSSLSPPFFLTMLFPISVQTPWQFVALPLCRGGPFFNPCTPLLFAVPFSFPLILEAEFRKRCPATRTSGLPRAPFLWYASFFFLRATNPTKVHSVGRFPLASEDIPHSRPTASLPIPSFPPDPRIFRRFLVCASFGPTPLTGPQSPQIIPLSPHYVRHFLAG